MKKSIVAIGLIFAMAFGFTTYTYAEETLPTLRIQADGEFENGGKLDLKEFEGMAPGEERIEQIVVVNDSEDVVNFYIKQEVLKTLEESNNAAGGAYNFDLLLGETKENAVSLLSKTAGGYSADGEGSTEGLAELDDFEEFTYLVQLQPGTSTNVFLKLKLDGEGNDNGVAGYANAVAELALTFRAKVVEPVIIEGETEIVTEIVTEYIYTEEIKEVVTGDENNYLSMVAILAAGLLLIGGAFLRKKKGEQ